MLHALSSTTKLAVLFSILLLTACRKFFDNHFPDGKANNCRITSIRQPDPVDGGTFRTGKFYYNHKGNPDKVIFDEGFASAKLHYFYYNQGHQLTAYDSYYNEDPENYYIKHKYVFENGRVVRDSAWIRIAGFATIVSYLHYDARDRIIREERRWIEADGEAIDVMLDPIVYSYNADGNLIKENVHYDDKISFYRTNHIWMFIERNYSVNNPLGASGYNEHALPVGFEQTNEVKFLGYEEPVAIGYQCK